jgi:hypothetical protein
MSRLAPAAMASDFEDEHEAEHEDETKDEMGTRAFLDLQRFCPQLMRPCRI